MPDKHKRPWVVPTPLPDTLREANRSFILVCAARLARGQSSHNSMLVHVTRIEIMPDVFTPEKRFAVMLRIRGSGNRDTELRMITLFRAHRIRGWRRNQPLFGKPDFVFHRERVAVFVDGCFWHGCPKPKHAPRPKNRAEWWAAKLERNKARDRLVTRTLRKQGWRVLRVWECDLAKTRSWPRIARRLALSPSAR